MNKAQFIKVILPVILVMAAYQLALAQSNKTILSPTDKKIAAHKLAHCDCHHDAMKQRMARELGLSLAQQEKLDAIHLAFKKAHQPDFEKMKADFRQLDAQVKAVLTRAQVKKMETLGMGPPPPPEFEKVKGGCLPPPPPPSGCGPW